MTRILEERYASMNSSKIYDNKIELNFVFYFFTKTTNPLWDHIDQVIIKIYLAL